ncbi:sulfur carrier protein ThiS [Desulfovibrio legallii]|jgi:thiamine biosynthesis protein ThiS|uniref:Thiazole synthase/sulfur carrier protein n=1 Tax=Desulfovibrio legallii TaxID=571438 RepID=A0A1G7ITU1_9BACT|nr:sulfur carrier protein ThiS [Desulfovibrio legallii]SDF15964.1 thiazole synthase/sulfur carrier protein [Desulfovibrio legallii]
MDIQVNGATEPHPEGCSVAEVLAARGHDPAAVVVERNGQILPRERFAQTPLAAGDRLEIVQFVGGG